MGIGATPRSKTLGLLADFVGNVNDFASKPFGYDNPPVQALMGLLSVPALANTLNEMSYGGALGTGSGMTWKPKADTMDALMTVAPMAMAAPGVINKTAAAIGKRVEPAVTRMVNSTMANGGLHADLLQGMSQGSASYAIPNFRPDYLKSLEKAISNKPSATIDMPALPDRLIADIHRSRAVNGQPPITSNTPYIPSETIGKFDWKRGGLDGQDPAAVTDMVNSLLYSGKTRPAASLKGEGTATALINAREPMANLGFLSVDDYGRPVLETAYKTKTPKIPQKLGVSVQPGGTRFPTLSPEGVSGSETFRSSDGFATLANNPPFVYPQDKALSAAQRNAALPVEQGGLGLHPNNTPMERAKAMGFDADSYHGTQLTFDNFDIGKSNSRSQYMPGVFTSDTPELANVYGGDGVVMPLMQKNGYTIADKVAARRTGQAPQEVDSIYDKTKGIRVTNNLANMRSRFAAFDPMRRNEPDLLAGAVPFGLLVDEEQRKRLGF